MNILELKNINCFYNKYKVIDNLSFKIKKGDCISILGTMATGKTTIAKFLSGNIKYTGDYLINGVAIVKENKYLIDRFVDIVTVGNRSNKKVVDLLFDALNESDIAKDKEEKIINKFIKEFNIDYVDKRLSDISYDKYYYVLIIASIIKGVHYIVLDDILCYLNKDMIDKIYSYTKSKKISIINITSNIDEILYSSYSLFLYQNKIVMEGLPLSCLKEEKILKRLGFNLPFMVNLTTQLMYYGVIDRIILDEKEMVDEIWN